MTVICRIDMRALGDDWGVRVEGVLVTAGGSVKQQEGCFERKVAQESRE